MALLPVVSLVCLASCFCQGGANYSSQSEFVWFPRNFYLTFRAVGMIIEMRDGVLTEFTLWQFLRFLMFLPTFSSGPIDRFKCFNDDYENIPERDELLDMLEKSIWYLMLGFLYKFIIAYFFGQVLLPPLKELCSSARWHYQPPDHRCHVCFWA